jgi:hypothetical protein
LRKLYNYKGFDLIPLIKAIPFDTPFDKNDIVSFCVEFLGENINKNVRNEILSMYFESSWSHYQLCNCLYHDKLKIDKLF